ncbi:DUF1127 domain-containing protein [Sedimentitalea sp. HM32M-2]|uniref:DUF1127 domain-containing protein n=1 Tax=Sedimentitalea sp. HM32M-2 TaxID=3351566 RepID=UPI003626D53F
MAHYATDHPAFGPTSNPIARAFAAIGTALTALGRSNARLRQVKALQALSDAQLQQIGLRRDQIARRVFSDVFWR